MKEFNVGDVIYHASYERTAIKEPCPICFGKLNVVLILGDNSRVELPCDYCNRGLFNPHGYIDTIVMLDKVTQYTITKKLKSEMLFITDKVEYFSDNIFLAVDRIFDNKKDAEICCNEIIRLATAEEQQRIEYVKSNIKKTFSWNAGYHLREIKKLEKDIEQHKLKAKLCTERISED